MLVDHFYNKHVTPLFEETPIKDALKTFSKEGFNGTAVINNENKLVGVISIQDIAGAIVPEEIKENPALAEALYKPQFFHELCAKIENKPIKEVMRTKFLSVTPQTSILSVVADFFHNDLYIVPVLAENKLLGVITRTEIKKAILAGLEKK